MEGTEVEKKKKKKKSPKKSVPQLAVGEAPKTTEDDLEKLPTARAQRAVSVENISDALRILQGLDSNNTSDVSSPTSFREREADGERKHRHHHHHSTKKSHHGTPRLRVPTVDDSKKDVVEPTPREESSKEFQPTEETKEEEDGFGRVSYCDALLVSGEESHHRPARRRNPSSHWDADRRKSAFYFSSSTGEESPLNIQELQRKIKEADEKKAARHHHKKHRHLELSAISPDPKAEEERLTKSLIVISPSSADKKPKKNMKSEISIQASPRTKTREKRSVTIDATGLKAKASHDKSKKKNRKGKQSIHDDLEASGGSSMLPDSHSDSSSSDPEPVMNMHTLMAAPNQNGLVLNTVCDVCGEKAPTLQCTVCGFMCHSVCECQAPPCVSKNSVSQMEALLSKKRLNVSKKASLASFFADPSQEELITPSSSAFSGSNKRLVKKEELPEEPFQTKLMTLLQVRKKLQRINDKYSQFLPQIILIQRAFRKEQFRQMREMSAKRMLIVKEIIDTERSYVDQLRMIINDFQVPLTKRQASRSPSPDPPNKPQDDSAGQLRISRGSANANLSGINVPIRLVKSIFGTVRPLCEAIEKTLSHLEKCVEDSSWNTVTGPVIGSVFISEIGNIAQHTDYVINFNEGLDALAKAQRNPQFAKRLRELLRASKVIDLTDLLVVPVQHVPRYMILIERLLDHTHVLHPDHAPLERALDMVKRLANYMNERRRMKETMQSLRNDFAGMQDVLVGKGRYLVKKGQLSSYPLSRRSKGTFDYCFLFNDMLVAAKEIVSAESSHGRNAEDVFNPRYAVILRIPLNEKTSLNPYSGDKDAAKHNVFELEYEQFFGSSFFESSKPSSDEPRTMTTTKFSAENDEEMKKWISSIREILECIAEEHAPPHIKSFEETLHSSEMD